MSHYKLTYQNETFHWWTTFHRGLTTIFSQTMKRLPLFIRTVILMLNYYHPNDHISRPNDKGEGLKTENRGRHFAKVSDWLTTLMKWFSTTNSSKSNAILTQLIHHKRSRRKLSTDKFCYDWLVATITVITDNMLIRNSFKVK